MSPAELRQGEAALLRVREAGSGSLEHRVATDSLLGWFAEHAQEVLAWTRTGLFEAGIEGIGPAPLFPAQNMVTRAPVKRDSAPAREARYCAAEQRILDRTGEPKTAEDEQH